MILVCSRQNLFCESHTCNPKLVWKVKEKTKDGCGMTTKTASQTQTKQLKGSEIGRWTHRMTRRQTCCWTCSIWWPLVPTTWQGTWSTGSWCTDHQAQIYSAESGHTPLYHYKYTIMWLKSSTHYGGQHKKIRLCRVWQTYLVIPKSDTFTSLFFETRQFLAACRSKRKEEGLTTLTERRFKSVS